MTLSFVFYLFNQINNYFRIVLGRELQFNYFVDKYVRLEIFVNEFELKELRDMSF